jgi:signal transduction histidine kinase
MNVREMLFTPRGFLIWGGAVLTVLGLIGFVALNSKTSGLGSFFWLDNSENISHLVLGVVALAAVFVPGLNDMLRPYYRWIVILVGLIALFFGVYGFVVAGGAEPNTFGLANLELGDNLLHLVVAVWAFAAAYWTAREPMAATR